MRGRGTSKHWGKPNVGQIVSRKEKRIAAISSIEKSLETRLYLHAVVTLSIEEGSNSGANGRKWIKELLGINKNIQFVV